MNKEKKYIQLPNSDTHNCFACSRKNFSGLHMKLFSDDESVYSWITVPDHLCGWNTLVHGGIISTMLDEIMGWTGLYLLKMITLTKTMTVDFLHTVHIGDRLKVAGNIVTVYEKKEAIIEGLLFNGKGKLCAKSKGNFSLLSPKIAKRLGVITNQQLSDFFKPLSDLKSCPEP